MNGTYTEMAIWPGFYGAWRYATLSRRGDDLQLTPVGESVGSRVSLPHWDGDVHPVASAQSPQQARVSDHLPDGEWLLAVMSENPGEVPHRRFTVCGPVRSGDPSPLVERLHSERTRGPLRGAANTLGRSHVPDEHRADGTMFTPSSAWESLKEPGRSGTWQYAAFDTDDRGVLRYTRIGPSIQAGAATPRWAGAVHPVVQTPRGMEPRDIPLQQAWESERMPRGEWVLGVVSESGRRTFTVAGPTRLDDPRAAVRALVGEVERHTARPNRERGSRSADSRTERSTANQQVRKELGDRARGA